MKRRFRRWERTTSVPASPGAAAAREAEPEFDLERVVWDPEYRDEVRARMKPGGLS